MTDPAIPLAAVVLAGGGSRRWGGRDKTAAELGGRAVLLRVVDAVPRGSVLVVVAPAGHPARDAVQRDRPGTVWTRERPPGGGPVAGLVAGLAVLAGLAPGRASPPLVLVLAGDLAFAGPAVPRLVAAVTDEPDELDGVLAVDPSGRRQPLLAVYRVAALDRAAESLSAGTASPSGASRGPAMHALLAGLRLREVPVTRSEAFDLDTPDALAQARLLLGATCPPRPQVIADESP